MVTDKALSKFTGLSSRGNVGILASGLQFLARHARNFQDGRHRHIYKKIIF